MPTISESTLRRVFRKLESLGILVTKRFNAWRYDQRKWHTINFDRLAEVMKSLPHKRTRRKSIKKDTPSSEKSFETPLEEAIPSESSEVYTETEEEHTTDPCETDQIIDEEDPPEHTQDNTSLVSPVQNTPHDSLKQMLNIWNKNIEE